MKAFSERSLFKCLEHVGCCVLRPSSHVTWSPPSRLPLLHTTSSQTSWANEQHTGKGGGEGGTKRFSFESNRDWRRRGEVSLKCCRSGFGFPSDHNSWVMLGRYHFHFSDIILDISLSLFIWSLERYQNSSLSDHNSWVMPGSGEAFNQPQIWTLWWIFRHWDGDQKTILPKKLRCEIFPMVTLSSQNSWRAGVQR